LKNLEVSWLDEKTARPKKKILLEKNSSEKKASTVSCTQLAVFAGAM
jgi:hypothetical protein